MYVLCKQLKATQMKHVLLSKKWIRAPAKRVGLRREKVVFQKKTQFLKHFSKYVIRCRYISKRAVLPAFLASGILREEQPSDFPCIPHSFKISILLLRISSKKNGKGLLFYNGNTKCWDKENWIFEIEKDETLGINGKMIFCICVLSKLLLDMIYYS